MVWFRVDDTFKSHPKVLSITRGAARLRAIGLWTSMGSWCANQLTDGRFAPHMIAEMGGAPADARRLVQVGLWHDLGIGCGTDSCPDGEPGQHQFHDYLDYNPSREKVLAERAAAAERQKRARDKAKEKADADGRKPRRHGVTHGDVTGVVTVPPTRPDPTPAAAAAGEPLPPPLEILRNALEAHKLHVRWDRLTAADAAAIEELINAHGDAALVRSALHQHQPGKPAAFVQAWLPAWKDLRRPGDLAAVRADPCTEPGHTGTTRHCKECASERLERKA